MVEWNALVEGANVAVASTCSVGAGATRVIYHTPMTDPSHSEVCSFADRHLSVVCLWHRCLKFYYQEDHYEVYRLFVPIVFAVTIECGPAESGLSAVQ
jgi:hypothetical protein